MDKEILEILKKLDNKVDSLGNKVDSLGNKFDSLEGKFDRLEERFDGLEGKFNNLELGQVRIEKKLDGVIEQTANLTEFRTETKDGIEAIKKDLNKVEIVTASNWADVAKLKAIK